MSNYRNSTLELEKTFGVSCIPFPCFPNDETKGQRLKHILNIYNCINY